MASRSLRTTSARSASGVRHASSPTVAGISAHSTERSAGSAAIAIRLRLGSRETHGLLGEVVRIEGGVPRPGDAEVHEQAAAMVEAVGRGADVCGAGRAPPDRARDRRHRAGAQWRYAAAHDSQSPGRSAAARLPSIVHRPPSRSRPSSRRSARSHQRDTRTTAGHRGAAPRRGPAPRLAPRRVGGTARPRGRWPGRPTA